MMDGHFQSGIFNNAFRAGNLADSLNEKHQSEIVFRFASKFLFLSYGAVEGSRKISLAVVSTSCFLPFLASRKGQMVPNLSNLRSLSFVSAMIRFT